MLIFATRRRRRNIAAAPGIDQAVSKTGKPQRGLEVTVERGLVKLNTAVGDQYAFIEKYTKQLQKSLGRKLPASEHPYVMARVYSGTAEAMGMHLERNIQCTAAKDLQTGTELPDFPFLQQPFGRDRLRRVLGLIE